MTDDKVDLSNTLASNYMLASLTVRCWTAKRVDSEASRKIIEEAGALAAAGAFHKSLFVGCDKELKDTRGAYNRIREWFYANSLPWTADDAGNKTGDRLIGTVQAMEFLRSFAVLKTQAEEARGKFLAVYDSAVQQAARNLGSMFDPSQYPAREQVAQMFDCSLRMIPMPAVSDFDRVSIPGSMAQGLQKLFEKSAQKQADRAVIAAQDRIAESLSRMVTQLDKVVDEQKPRLYKSLLTNIKTVVGLAKALGPLSPELDELASEIDDKILVQGQRDVADFKDNVALSRDVSDKAKAILQKVKPEETQSSSRQGAVSGTITATVKPAGPVPTSAALVTTTTDIEFDEDSVFDLGD